MNLVKLFILGLFIVLLFLITGCSTTVPVKAKFPEVPVELKERCTPLKKLEDTDNLSTITKTITDNYTKYQECSVNNNAWIEWYQIQKTIYEKVK